MMFCPTCKGILLPKQEAGKKLMVCIKCGYKSQSQARLSEKIAPKKTLEVVETEIDVLPTVETTCPDCGHTRAKFWTQQTRAGDEGDTKFFKCEKCKHTWRDYS